MKKLDFGERKDIKEWLSYIKNEDAFIDMMNKVPALTGITVGGTSLYKLGQNEK